MMRPPFSRLCHQDPLPWRGDQRNSSVIPLHAHGPNRLARDDTVVNVYASIIVLCISIDKHHKNKITKKYTFTRDTTFILGNPLGEENPAKTSLS
jgi:hypothetical protein